VWERTRNEICRVRGTCAKTCSITEIPHIVVTLRPLPLRNHWKLAGMQALTSIVRVLHRGTLPALAMALVVLVGSPIPAPAQPASGDVKSAATPTGQIILRRDKTPMSRPQREFLAKARQSPETSSIGVIHAPAAAVAVYALTGGPDDGMSRIVIPISDNQPAALCHRREQPQQDRKSKGAYSTISSVRVPVFPAVERMLELFCGSRRAILLHAFGNSFKVPDRGSVNPTPLGGMGLPRAPRGLACGFPRTGIHLTNGPLSAQSGARYSPRSIKARRNHK
jgi:hypothetical protein